MRLISARSQTGDRLGVVVGDRGVDEILPDGPRTIDDSGRLENVCRPERVEALA